MAFPLLAVLGWAGSGAAVSAAVSEVMSGDRTDFAPVDALRRLAASVVNYLAGEELLQAEDLSGRAAVDAALARIISARSPIPVRSVLDKDVLRRDLLDGAAVLVSDKAGFPIRTLFDKDMLKEDLFSAGAGLLEQKTGVRLSNVLDPEAIKADVLAWGANRLATETGIYLSNPADMEAVKADILEFGAQMGMARIVEDLKGAVNATDKDGVRLSALLAKAGLGNVQPADMVKNANSVLLGYANRRFAQVKVESKKERRREQLRRAQKRFRARHSQPWSSLYSGIPGGMQYVSVKGYKAGKGKDAAKVAEPLPVADAQQGAGFKPMETLPQSKASWAKDGKFAAGREEYPISKPAMPAGLDIGKRK